MFTFLRKKNSADAAAAGRGSKQAFLFVSDGAWRLRIVDPDQPGKVEDRTGDDPDQLEAALHTGDTEPLYSALFLKAAETIKTREAQALGQVHLLLDDDGVLYGDRRKERLGGTGAGALLSYGREQLGCPQVIYGVGPFGPPPPPGGRAQGVAGFIDATRIGVFLTRIDRIALKVTSVTPVQDLIARRALATGEAYAGLYLGHMNAHLVVANPAYNAVLCRVLRFGPHRLARVMAEQQGVSVEDALGTLENSNLMSDLVQDPSANSLDTLISGQSERILGEVVRGFVAEIEATLDFFESQHCCGRPWRLELFGDFERIKGFERVLSWLSVPSQPGPGDLFDLFIATPAAERLNLLSEVGDNLKIGSARYRLKGDRLEAAPQPVRPPPSASGPRRTASKGGGRRGRRGTRGNSADESGSSFFSLFKRSSADSAVELGDPGDGSGTKKDREGFLLLLLLATGAIYAGFLQLEQADAAFKTAVYQITAASADNSRLRQSLVQNTPAFQSQQAVDKVLWTEKFLALASHMKKEMWLTDLYLKNDTRSIEKSTVNSKKLVLEGALLPSTDGHLRMIAEYVAELEKDTASFMSDFRDLTFQGMALDSSDRDEVVRFMIECWYDEVKGRQQRQIRTTAEPRAVGIDEMQENVQERNRVYEQSLPSAVRR